MSWSESFARARSRLFRRRDAYRAVFQPQGEVGPMAEIVLKDLAHYCYALRPTLKVSQVTQQSDPIAMAFAEGRRDVFNRIIGLCNLSSDQIDRIAHQRTQDD